MNFHEYQAKELFAAYGIPVPAGIVAATPLAAVEAARELGGEMWVVKAQVHAGGRGKAGGVKLAKSLEEVRAEAERMLNMKISTYQTGGLELPVDNVLIAEAVDIASELYLSALVDRVHRCVTFMGSAAGGVDIVALAVVRPARRRPGVSRGLRQLPRLRGLGTRLRGVDRRGLGGQALPGRDEGDRLAHRPGARRPGSHGRHRRVLRRLPVVVDRQPDRSLRVHRQPRRGV